MAVVLAVQRWRPYLLVGKFKVKTDQKALKFLLDQRVIQPQYQKWIAKLLGYSFEVVYKPGVENRAADALSRKPAKIQLFGLSITVTVDLERNKSLASSPAGLLVPLEIPQSIWSDISMEFVEGLPKSGGFEVILVVDRLSKYGHFLPLKHPFTAKLGAELFVKEMVVYGQQPPAIVSYGGVPSKNSTVEEMLWERDNILTALRDHLRLAQE
ncbi:uncharacterized protein LOC127148667 [Cucumis melo]|uniref:Uncharacterized protein LOC127148667 n=1 Tax=Cucumis melo TaxID=3656 RepID=A0ABM3KM27_CUCME|nr:uncharacterized protein LOC127148667 [Cucumis melo]